MQIYTFSGGKLKVVTNTNYTTIKNQYELTFDERSEIRPSIEDNSIQKTNYNFVKIADINNIDLNSIIDVIAIVKSVGEYIEIPSKQYQGMYIMYIIYRVYVYVYILCVYL